MFRNLFILFNNKDLEFWVMEIINIYEFFHFKNLTKINPNMDFGKNLAFANICHNTFFILFST